MAISKRLRFEVLRRDGFQCYYCGTRGNETANGLTIDHVVPVALGGTDDAENLVAACGDCNAGKTSTSADDALIAQVNQATAVARAAQSLALSALKADLAAEQEYRELVWSVWGNNAPSYLHGADGELDGYVDTWFKEGVPMELVDKAFRIAFDNRDVPGRSKIAYAGGVIRNTMRDAESRAQSLAAGNDVIYEAGVRDGFARGRDAGYQTGWESHRDEVLMNDLLMQHIDQTEPCFEPSPFDDSPMFLGLIKRGA